MEVETAVIAFTVLLVKPTRLLCVCGLGNSGPEMELSIKLLYMHQNNSTLIIIIIIIITSFGLIVS